jgi:hypothetical protein
MMVLFVLKAEMHGYHVEVIDSTGNPPAMREANDNV